MSELLAWLKSFIPAPILAARREKAIACLGACVGIGFAEWFSRITFGEANPWFIAPIGASAVLLFAVPASPLAQPWSIIGGNVISALIGVTCAKWIPDPAVAAAVAGAMAIAAMFSLRCLHPPGGAVALTAVLGGPAVTTLGYGFVIFPVAINSGFLLLMALVFNNLLRRRYPHQPHQGNRHGTSDPPPVERLGFTRADLDAAIKEYDELLDVNEDDLQEIFLQAELRAFSRRSGDIRCADIMSRDIVFARPDMTVAQAWAVLSQHDLSSLPVVNSTKRLIGIVTLRDLVAAADGGPPRLRNAVCMRDIMTTKVQVAHATQTIMELVPLFSDRGFHHLPVVDESRSIVGIITQSDLVAALYRRGLEASRVPVMQAVGN
ncbi:HPP family protein [Noviherbaspirillum saxi]|uniref:HPP family protein n=1 Tax=Noviherbaspirillum saxi TaxID=2320863 RepID=A0A3A3FRF3_9BURK|nr:HPP family protein [Noviherbaspirillum saxi]RJF96022.1 HPP family protein [Noviherbaspirillum saxi]